MTNKQLDLTGPWQFKPYPRSARRMRDLDGQDWLDTTVPSSIFTSLVEAGRIDSFDLAANPENYDWVSREPWVFQKEFELPDDFSAADRIDLVCEGLDTIAQVWLNGRRVGTAENMFIPHRFDVTEHLQPSRNQLRIRLDPPLEYADRHAKRYGILPSAMFGNQQRVYIRKAQYNFGWDWCPPLPGCGIFRPIRLEAHKHARIEDIHIRTIDCNEQYADLRIAVEIESYSAEPVQCDLHVTGGGLDMHHQFEFAQNRSSHSAVIRIDRPILWWPTGYGVPHLYKLTTQLTQNENPVEKQSRNFGIRTIRLDQSKDKIGHNFQFIVNDRPIYVRGANWIPLTLFPGVKSPEEHRQMVRTAGEANINMLRIWGGGLYEDPAFYEECDRRGILVWQDFMFACSCYPDRKWFMDQIHQEAVQIIRRLRNHPSLALWCGNNESHCWFYGTESNHRKKFYGRKIFESLLPEITSQLDPDRNYIPTTPLAYPLTNGKRYGTPDSGTIHQWNIWGGRAPSDNYLVTKDRVPRFVSEFGFQSLPAPETIETFVNSDKVKPGSSFIEKHNYMPYGNTRVVQYMAENFAIPEDLDTFVYYSQLTQARAVDKYVRRLRLHNHRNHGMIFWQLQDCCPGITWSAIDYRLQPKALYYYARRFFAPVIIAVDEIRQELRFPDVTPSPGSKSIHIINDSTDSLTGRLQCDLMDLYGTTLDRFEKPVSLLPHKKSLAIPLPLSMACPANPRQCFLHMQFLGTEKIYAEYDHFFYPDKELEWPANKVEMQIEKRSDREYQLVLDSNSPIRDVWVRTSQSAVISPNWLTLIPGNRQSIKVVFCPPPKEPLNRLFTLNYISSTTGSAS